MREFLRKKPKLLLNILAFAVLSFARHGKEKRQPKSSECGRKGYYKFGFNQGEEFWKGERKQQFGSNSAPSGKVPSLTPLHEIISVAFLQADSRSAWLVRLAHMLR